MFKIYDRRTTLYILYIYSILQMVKYPLKIFIFDWIIFINVTYVIILYDTNTKQDMIVNQKWKKKTLSFSCIHQCFEPYFDAISVGFSSAFFLVLVVWCFSLGCSSTFKIHVKYPYVKLCWKTNKVLCGVLDVWLFI